MRCKTFLILFSILVVNALIAFTWYIVITYKAEKQVTYMSTTTNSRKYEKLLEKYIVVYNRLKSVHSISLKNTDKSKNLIEKHIKWQLELNEVIKYMEGVE